MNDGELRKHFDLRPCPNPGHAFSIGRLTGEWVWAQDCWSQLVGERLQTLHFSLHSIRSRDGLRAHSIVIWRLKVIWGFTK